MTKNRIDKGYFIMPNYQIDDLTNPIEIGVWTLLMRNANYKSIDILWRGKTRLINPGQFAFNITQTAKEMALPKTSLRRFIDKFIASGWLVKETTKHETLLTIVDYDMLRGKWVSDRNDSPPNIGPTSVQTRSNETLDGQGLQDEVDTTVVQHRSNIGPIPGGSYIEEVRSTKYLKPKAGFPVPENLESQPPAETRATKKPSVKKKPNYTDADADLADKWLKFAKQEKSGKLAQNWNKEKFAAAIAKTKRLSGLTDMDLELAFGFVQIDSFWRKTTPTPMGLDKIKDNGSRKIENLMAAMKQNKDYKVAKIRDERPQPPTAQNFNEMIADAGISVDAEGNYQFPTQ